VTVATAIVIMVAEKATLHFFLNAKKI